MLNCFSNSSTSTHDFSVFSSSRAKPEYILQRFKHLRAIINLNTCRNSKLKLSLLIYIPVKRKLRRQTEEMVYCLVQGLIYKLGLLKSQTLTEGN